MDCVSEAAHGGMPVSPVFSTMWGQVQKYQAQLGRTSVGTQSWLDPSPMPHDLVIHCMSLGLEVFAQERLHENI